MAGKKADDPKDLEVANLAAAGEAAAAPKNPIQEIMEEDAEFGKPPAGKAKEPAPAPEPEAKAPAKPAHHRYLVSRALRHGANIDQINATDSEDLELWVEEQDFSKESASPAPAPKAVEQPKTDLDEDLGIEKEVVDSWEPKFTGLMKKLAKENKQLQETVKAQADREVARERKSIDDQLDNAFESLGGDYQKLLGSGTFEELLASKSIEAKRRIAVFNAAGIDVKKLPPGKVLAKKLKAAADELFGPAAEAEAEDASAYKEASDAVQPLVRRGRFTKEQFREGGLAAPTSRTKELKPGREAALKHIQERQAATSMHLDPNEELNGRVPE